MFYAKKTCEERWGGYWQKRGLNRDGFSMVEVALALGIMAFALLSILALLPLGVKSNQISAEETRAAMILTSLEADLRNTHPGLNGGKSALYGLELPYQTNASGVYLTNSALGILPSSLASGSNTIGLDDAENPVPITASSRFRFQVSVIYQAGTNALASRQARLVVNWPSLTGPSIPRANVTDLTKVSGYLETVVSFPAP